MAWMYQGYVKLRGDAGATKADKQIKGVRFPWSANALSNANIAALRTMLLSYSDCVEDGRAIVQKRTEVSAPPGVDANIDVKAKIFFKNTVNGKVHSIEIPAPVSTMFELVGQGNRVKQADVVAIVADISTQLGETFIPLYGKKIQRG